MNKIFIITQPEITTTVGGAIKSCCNLCNLFAENGYIVYLICHNQQDGLPYIKLNEKVNFVNLYYLKNDTGVFNTMSNKFEYFTKQNTPDLMIFFFPHIMEQALKYDKFPEIPKILSYRSRPDFYFEYVSNDFEKNIIQHTTYNHVLYNSFIPIIKQFSNSPAISIGNVVETPNQKADLPNEKKKIVYLSRVDEFKGHDFLINSFAVIAKKYPDWQLDIYGEFQPLSMKNKLQNLINQFDLENQIFLKGVTKNPIQEMLNYDFCVFPSYFEGFPNGLVEALSVGLPVIGLEKSSGVNELIVNEYNGFLVEFDINKFAEKIAMLINKKEMRIKMGCNAIESVQKYSSEIINQKWLKFTQQALGNEKIENPTYVPQDKIMFSIYEILKLTGIQNKYCNFVSIRITTRNCFIWIFNLPIKFSVQNIFLRIVIKILKIIKNFLR